MHKPKNLRLLTLAALVFITPATRAGVITPDAIPNPPPMVGSANGTPVAMSNIVDIQYRWYGFYFDTERTAISRLNGTPVWVPVSPINYGATPPPSGSPYGKVNYYAPWYGGLLYGQTGRLPVSSLTVETINKSGLLSLSVYGDGRPLKITPLVHDVPGTIGEKIWQFNGSGIEAFSAVVIPPPVAAGTSSPIDPSWGVASVSFTLPAGESPEPSSLVLAGLGALSLAARFGWRRRRGEIA